MEYPEIEPTHRHVSHLYSLYPGHDINLRDTPELAAATRNSLELRGDGGTGWSTVWRVALWARLQNPEHAYNNLKILVTTSTLPNMFDLCPPFQIDGNLGGPAAIAEMLVQSTSDEIRVLPALPRQWSSGSLTGVRIRGGARLDITWSVGRLTELQFARCPDSEISDQLWPAVNCGSDSTWQNLGFGWNSSPDRTITEHDTYNRDCSLRERTLMKTTKLFFLMTLAVVFLCASACCTSLELCNSSSSKGKSALRGTHQVAWHGSKRQFGGSRWAERGPTPGMARKRATLCRNLLPAGRSLT